MVPYLRAPVVPIVWRDVAGEQLFEKHVAQIGLNSRSESLIFGEVRARTD